MCLVTVVRKGHKCALLPLHEPGPTQPTQLILSMLLYSVRMEKWGKG